MTINKSTDAALAQRTNVWAEQKMLEYAHAVTVTGKFADTKVVPQNKSGTVKWRRPKPFTEATAPLVEGVTPDSTSFEYEDVQAQLKQYGMVITITDVIAVTHEDPVLQDIVEQAGENIGRTMEAINYGVLKGGTNVFYQNGSARNQVNTAITLNKQRAVTQALRRQKGMKITKMLSGSVNYKTEPVEGAYVALGHTDLEHNIRGLAGFIPTAQYGTKDLLCPEEIGRVEDVRYILSPDLSPLENAGGAKNGMVSTGGSNADVYPIIYLSKHAFGTVALKGKQAVKPYIIPVDKATKDDALAQRGSVGWKTWHAAVRLNELWMARLEVAATDLAL